MSEDFAIQQQRPSAAPYLLGGAAVGGVAGYGLDRWKHWATQPAKYSSYEDLIKEKEDAFTKNMEGVEEGLKTKAEEARKAAEEAGTKWDNEWKTFQEANKAGETPQLPEDHDAMKSLKDAEGKLTAKREELVNTEVERLKGLNPTEAAGGEVKSTTYQKALDYKAKQIAGARGRLETLKAEKAPMEKITAAQQEVDKLTKELDQLSKDIAEKLEYTGSEAEIKAAKEKAAKGLRTYAEDKVGVLEYNRVAEQQVIGHFRGADGRIYSRTIKDVVSKQTGYQNQLAAAEGNIEKLFSEAGEITGKDIKSIYGKDSEVALRQVNIHKNLEEKHLQKLEQFKKAYEQASKTAGTKDPSKLVQFLQRVLGTTPAPASEAEVLKKFLGDMSEAQKKDLEKLLGSGEVSLKGLEEAIKNSESRIKTLSNFNSNIAQQNKVINNAKKELNGLKKALEHDYGKGTHIKDGVLYDLNGKPIKTKAKTKSPIQPKIELPANAKVPKDGIKIEYTAGKKVALTEEQILEKAKANVTDDMVKTERDAVEAAKKAVEEARAKLPKNPEIPEEELMKKFAENKGSRDEVIKKATEGFKDDLKKLTEGKMNKGKLTAIIGGGAILGAIIGSALRPKAKEV